MVKRLKDQSFQCWLELLWSTFYIHICSDTSAVAVSSLQSVSNIAIHYTLAQIERALIQKESLQNNYLAMWPQAQTPHSPSQPKTHIHTIAVQTQTCIQNTCIYAFTDTLNMPNKCMHSQRLCLNLHSPTNTAAPLCGVMCMHATNVQPTSHQAHGHCCRFIKDGGWSDSCI